MADTVDYSDFITRAPQMGNPLMGVFEAIAKAKQQRAAALQAQAEEADQSDAARAFKQAQLNETTNKRLDDEVDRSRTAQEIGRHNLATEGNAAGELAQKKADAVAKFLSDEKFRADLGSNDPHALAQWEPALQAHGLQRQDFPGADAPPPSGPAPAATSVEPPGITGDAQGNSPNLSVNTSMSPDVGAPPAGGPPPPAAAPPSAPGPRRYSGGGVSMTFDPVQNALARTRMGDQAQQQMEQVAGETTDPFVAGATRDVAKLTRIYLAQGMDPVKAGQLAAQQITQRSGQASTRRNTDVASQARASTYAAPEMREAGPINNEITGALKDVTAKGGLKDQLLHSEAALSELKKNPNNPVVWTNAIDSMIRTNTGRAAITAQYNLYKSHAAGKVDSFDQFVENMRSGMPSAEQRKNLHSAMEASNAELRGQAKDVYENFRRYDQDPRVKRNQLVREHYNATERNVFGNMPGYGGAGGGEKLQAAVEAAKARIANPNETPERKARAQQFLKEQGQ